MGNDFVLLAGSAAFDIVRDPDIHSGPPEVILSFPDCFIASGVSGSWGVVYLFHTLPLFLFGGHSAPGGGGSGNESLRGYDGDSLVVIISLVCIRGPG